MFYVHIYIIRLFGRKYSPLVCCCTENDSADDQRMSLTEGKHSQVVIKPQ